MLRPYFYFFFFFNDPATTEIYTLSLHDALPIYAGRDDRPGAAAARAARLLRLRPARAASAAIVAVAAGAAARSGGGRRRLPRLRPDPGSARGSQARVGPGRGRSAARGGGDADPGGRLRAARALRDERRRRRRLRDLAGSGARRPRRPRPGRPTGRLAGPRTGRGAGAQGQAAHGRGRGSRGPGADATDVRRAVRAAARDGDRPGSGAGVEGDQGDARPDQLLERPEDDPGAVGGRPALRERDRVPADARLRSGT